MRAVPVADGSVLAPACAIILLRLASRIAACFASSWRAFSASFFFSACSSARRWRSRSFSRSASALSRSSRFAASALLRRLGLLRACRPSRSRSARPRAAARPAPARRAGGTGFGSTTTGGRRLGRRRPRRGDLRQRRPELGDDTVGLARLPVDAPGERDDQQHVHAERQRRSPEPMPGGRRGAKASWARAAALIVGRPLRARPA